MNRTEVTMDDFRVKVGFVDHPKVGRLRRRLGPIAVEAVIRLWDFCTKARRDGSLHGMDADDIADVCRWEGEPRELVDALEYAHLLDPCDGGWCVHDWAEEQPWVSGFEERSRRAKEAARSRWRKEKPRAPEDPQEVGEPKEPPRGSAAAAKPEPPLAGAVREVIGHYRTYHPQALKRPRSDSKEWRLVAARLREGYTVEQLCAAVDGCHMTPHNLGQNDRGTKYLGLGLIMRDGDQVTRFMETAQEGGPRAVPSAREASGRRAAEAWLRRDGSGESVLVDDYEDGPGDRAVLDQGGLLS